MPSPLRFLLALLAVGSVLSAQADTSTRPTALDQAWDNASLLLVQDAYAEFTAARAIAPGLKRELDYGQALALLTLQPKTVTNIDRAAALFAQITAANPNDELGIASLYFLARVEQIHRDEPNITLAISLYSKLILEHPDHPLAQASIVKIAILQLNLPPFNQDRKKILAQTERSRMLVTDPVIRSNLDYILGNACIRYQLGDELAQKYLIEADSLGIPIQKLAAQTLVQIGNLSLKMGRKDTAILYFERFVKTYPRDIRNYTIRQKLLELQGAKR